MKKRSKTNWERIDALSDEAIDYSGNPELTATFFDEAVRWPVNKELISLRLDPDVLGFFRRRGKGNQTAINTLLRRYMERQKQQSPDTASAAAGRGIPAVSPKSSSSRRLKKRS